MGRSENILSIVGPSVLNFLARPEPFTMEARLTEFSYGYCVTEELANGAGPGFKAAPYFPSLYAEGKEGGGFDVQLGSALFLQFKLSDELTRRNANETKLGLLNPTFFRFSLH